MPHQPPRQTFASRQLARVLPMVGSRSRPSSWALALTMAAGILLFQYLMPPSASVIFLLLLLAAQSVWFLGGRAGLAVTGATVIVGSMCAAVVNHDETAVGIALQVWNAAARLMSIGLMGFVLTGLRSALEVERWRASTDQLTGALNRAMFDERLGPTLRQAAARGEALLLAYMDLDGFKGVNDRHGHAAGNRVLAAFACSAQSAMRGTDTFARIGGDEFAALLCVPSAVEGDRVAELLHNRLSAILAGTGYSVTCSMGALVMEARQMAREESILDQADRLMYIAKQSGKNAVHIGRGEAVEARLRAAFPPEPGVPGVRDMLQWVDQPDRPAPDRRRA